MDIKMKCPGCGHALAPLKDAMHCAVTFVRRSCRHCERVFSVTNQPILDGAGHVTTVRETYGLTPGEYRREQARNGKPCTCGHHRGWHDEDGCGQPGCPCEKFTSP